MRKFCSQADTQTALSGSACIVLPLRHACCELPSWNCPDIISNTITIVEVPEAWEKGIEFAHNFTLSLLAL
jgi:hypothetical protein